MLGYDAPRWHALLNDFPAALLVVAVLFDLAAAVGKRESLKWAGAWTLWAGVLGGWVAVVSGKLAEKAIEHGDAIHELMEQHERRALVTMSIIGVVGICYVGAAGGELAFEHAAGVPTKMLEAEVENREAGHEHEPGETDDHEHAAPADTAKGGH